MSNYAKFNVLMSVRLIWMLSKRDLQNRYAGSYAGFFWNIGVPLFNALIMATIFSVLMGGRMGLDYGDIPFVLFYFIPFSLWIVFADVVGRSTGILREYSYLINKISFPYWTLPLIPFASAILSQSIIMAVVIGLTYYFNIAFAPTMFMFVVIWLASLVMTIGVAYAVSAISVYLPDMSQLVPLCLNILFWMTPILYPPSLVEQHAPEWLKGVVITLNPFYYISEYSRYALLSGVEIPLLNLSVLVGVVCLSLLLGVFLFHKLKSGFADVL